MKAHGFGYGPQQRFKGRAMNAQDALRAMVERAKRGVEELDQPIWSEEVELKTKSSTIPVVAG